LTRDDLDYFFDGVQCLQLFTMTLRAFMLQRRIEACQESPMEKNVPEQEMLEEFILKNVGRTPKNNPCPCGSSKNCYSPM